MNVELNTTIYLLFFQYRFFGPAVVRACVENGAHHLDISGEPQVNTMMMMMMMMMVMMVMMVILMMSIQ